MAELNSYLDEMFMKKKLKEDEMNIFYRLKELVEERVGYLFKEGIANGSILSK